MTFQSVPDCAEAVIKATIEGVNVFNVLNFWKPLGYTQADIDNLAGAVDGAWASNFLPDLHSSYSYAGTFVRGLQSIIDLSAANTTGAGPGSRSGDSFPNNVAFVLTLYTGLTGRSARGRTYIPAIPASVTATNNTLSSAYAAELVADMNAVKAAALVVGWNMTIVSRISGGVRRTSGVNNVVTSVVARNLVLDSQRNRLPSGH